MSKKNFFLIAVFVFVFCAAQTINAQEDVKRLLQELETSADRFAKSFDNAADNSDLNGTSTEGEATRYVHEFEDSIDKLKKQYDKNKDTKIAATDALNRAKAINGVMNKFKMDEASQTDWKSVKIIIGRLAKHHELELDW